jgi:hypothetical protein
MGPLARFLRRLRYGRPIVVVSGLPRSGTSMMMQMLRAGGLEIVTDARRAPDDNNPRGYYELEAVKDLDKDLPAAWLSGARGKAVKIVSTLVRWLPPTYDYRVIFMQRDLDEVMASQKKMLLDRGTPPDEAQDERVRQFYGQHVDETLRLLRSRRWVSTLVVDHRDVMARPGDAARRVNAFLGGALDEQRMAEAVAPGLYRNRT